jgi:hypothetical protein
LVTAGTERERKILAADSCRGSAARAVKASQPDPQEKHGEYEMKPTCQRVAATDRKHESRVVSEDGSGRRGEES